MCLAKSQANIPPGPRSVFQLLGARGDPEPNKTPRTFIVGIGEDLKKIGGKRGKGGRAEGKKLIGKDVDKTEKREKGEEKW